MSNEITISGDGMEKGYLHWANSFKIELGGLNVSKMMVDAEGPEGIKPEVTLTVKDGIMDCTYKCNVEGDYKFAVQFDEEHVEGSPFVVKVEGEFLIPVEKVIITGPGIKEGRKGQFNEINIDPRESGITFPLQYHIEGSSKPDINLRNNGNGTCTLRYKAYTPGVYKLQLKYMEKHLPGSPFQIRVK